MSRGTVAMRERYSGIRICSVPKLRYRLSSRRDHFEGFLSLKRSSKGVIAFDEFE
jgi:hypothetical protein